MSADWPSWAGSDEGENRVAIIHKGGRRPYCYPATSFSAHKRDALDATMPLDRRMSHLRSCAMLMGQKYRVPRSTIIERVLRLCDVDITIPANEAEVQRAVQALVQIKESGLDDSAVPPAG